MQKDLIIFVLINRDESDLDCTQSSKITVQRFD